MRSWAVWKGLELCIVLSLLPMSLVPAQTNAPASATTAPSPGPSYALQVQSRLVVEDVTVIDSKGNPVNGLPESAFHIFDNDRAQSIRDFRERQGSEDPEATHAPAVSGPERHASVTNASLFGNRGTVVAILIDPATMSLEEQMYFRIQALRFIDSAPATTSISVFRVNNYGVPVLLQSMTHDRAELRTAISAAVPVLTRPTVNAFRDAVTELKNISDYLRRVPGRKAVIWAAGKFPLYEEPDFGGLCHGGGNACGTHDHAVHSDLEDEAFRALEEARISVYPVDVRGVMMGGLSFVPVASSGADTDIGSKPTSESERVTGQYDEMDRLANATGGRAFYSNSNVAGILEQALQLTTEGYTLTYRPQEATANGEWHKVVVHVDGLYKLQYRNGYYAAKAIPSAFERAGSNRRNLMAEAERPAAIPEPKPTSTPANSEAAENSKSASATPGLSGKALEPSIAPNTALPDDRPLLFTAHFLAQPTNRSSGQIGIRYVIPTDQLLFDGAGAGHAHFRLAALAYNADGDVLSHAMEIIDTHYNADQMRLATRIGTPADQTVTIAKGAKYLLLAVEDLRSGRVGTVQLPVGQIRTGTD